MRRLALVLALPLCAAPAPAQSFNLDLGTWFGTPPATYGAAGGSAGHWNEIDMTGPPDTQIPLLDLGGAPSAVTVQYSAQGNGNYAFNHPGTAGGAERLLDDLCDVGNAAETRFLFRHLQAGTYQVVAYAWAPDSPVAYRPEVEVVGGALGAQISGGVEWPGDLALGATHVVDFVASTGVLRVRFSPSAGYASANAIQLIGPLVCGSAAEAYCTAGTSASGCRALLSTTGTASATAPSGFVLSASGVEGAKDGLFFFGTNGRQANPWGNGTSYQCVVAPVQRGGLLTGTGSAGACDGALALDLNARWTARPSQNPGAGATVQAQLWYRDPLSTSNQTTGLSNAVELSVCP